MESSIKSRDKTDAGGRDKAIGMPAELKLSLQLETEREQVLPQPWASQQQLQRCSNDSLELVVEFCRWNKN